MLKGFFKPFRMTKALLGSLNSPAEIVGPWVASPAIAQKIVPYLKVSEDCGFKPNCMLVVDYKNPDGSK